MNTKGIIAIAAGVLLVVFVRWEVARSEAMERLETQAAQAALVRDTLEAARDTSRLLPLTSVLGDSLRSVQRRASQVELRADKLDAALRLERVAREQVEATVVALRASVRSDTVFVGKGDSVRRASFEVRQAPYTVHAEVSIPAPPASGRMDLGVELDTLALDVRLGCGDAGREGVRPAAVTLVGPAWAQVRLSRLEQAPSVCLSYSGAIASERWAGFAHFLDRFGLSVGYAAARSSTGAVVVGPGLLAGFRVWP